MPKTRIFLAVSFLILASFACNTLIPTAEPTPIVLLEPTNPSQPSDLPVTQDDVPRVDVNVAKAALDSGAAVMVDVRSVERYNESHAVGALSIPLDNFETDIASVGLDKEQWIITYCT